MDYVKFIVQMKSTEYFPASVGIPCWFVSVRKLQAEVHTVPFTAIKHCCLQRYISPDLAVLIIAPGPECLF